MYVITIKDVTQYISILENAQLYFVMDGDIIFTLANTLIIQHQISKLSLNFIVIERVLAYRQNFLRQLTNAYFSFLCSMKRDQIFLPPDIQNIIAYYLFKGLMPCQKKKNIYR